MRSIFSLISALLLAATVNAQSLVNIGSSPNDQTGDSLRSAMAKINGNFTNIFGQVSTSGVIIRSDLSYTNPSWISSLAWSKLTGTPTTLSGYGISDGITSSTAASTYAPIASPALTGTPTAPTATVDTVTSQLATTGFVLGQVSTATPLVDGTSAVGTSLRYARADHVHPTDTSRAALASPTFTGTPTAPTATVDTVTSQIATTGFVLGQVSTATPIVDGTGASGTSLRYARGDHVHPTDTSRAPLASPTFTGVPAAPTAAVDTSTTQLATTAYVVGQGYAKLSSPALTGTPTVPTAAVDTATTQAASTAYVVNQAYAKLASPTFTGTPTVPGYLTTATAASTYAPLASPTFTGSPTVPGYLTTATAASTYLPLAGGTLTGNLLFTDNTYSIGSTSGNRPLNDNLTGVLNLWNGTSTTQRASLQSSGDGILALLNNAGTGFSRMSFGPATSSHPAIKRVSGTKLGIRLGDDTADADLTCAVLTGSSDASINGVKVGKGGSSIANNTALGVQALNAATGGGTCAAVGYQALSLNLDSTYCVALGYQAGRGPTTGNYITAIGAFACANSLCGGSTVGVGYGAASGAGYSNIAIGDYAFQNGTSASSTANIAIGIQAMGGALGTVGANIAIGYQALYGATGGTDSSNVAIGYQACRYQNTASSSGNTAIGSLALQNNVTGIANAAVGYHALYQSTADSCTSLGSYAGSNLTGGSGNITCIGYNAQASTTTIANEITLGNSSIATLRCQVTTITSLSDKRDKKDIESFRGGLEFLRDLNPVTFTWNARDGSKVGQPDIGFIAQELATAENLNQPIPGLVYRANPDRLEAGYGKLLPVIVAAAKEEDDRVTMALQMIEELTAEVRKLRAELKSKR